MSTFHVARSMWKSLSMWKSIWKSTWKSLWIAQSVFVKRQDGCLCCYTCICMQATMHQAVVSRLQCMMLMASTRHAVERESSRALPLW